MVCRRVGTYETATRVKLTDLPSNPGIIVLARLDSHRLPGKALEDVCGAPLVERVISRLSPVAPVVLATSDRAVDDQLCEFAAAKDMPFFRGPADDVLGRFAQAARAYGFDPVVRISGDSPFVDPGLVKRMVAEHMDGSTDLTTNIAPRTFPPGNSVEVLSMGAVERMNDLNLDAEDREHVTRFIYRNGDGFSIRNIVSCKTYEADLALTVDEPDDLEKARWITSRLPNPATAEFGEIVALARDWSRQ